MTDLHTTLDTLYRSDARRLTVALTRVAGGRADRAEAAVHEAFVRAHLAWTKSVPDNPSGWLRTVARNVLVDTARRAQVRDAHRDHAQRAPVVPAPEAVLSGEWDDELLRMIFAACDPRLTSDEQVAFALRVLCGVADRSLAQLFGVPEATIRKRLSRARQKLRATDAPRREHSAERLATVIRVLYAVFTEGHKARSGTDPLRADLVLEAIRLSTVLRRQWLSDPRPVDALLALMKLTAARIPARLGPDERLIPLRDQDRTRWNMELVQEGLEHLRNTATGDTIDPLQLEAVIAACHCLAPTFEATNWDRVIASYDALYALRPTVVVGTNRAVAIGWRDGAEAGLAALDQLDGEGHLPWHASRASLLDLAGDKSAAKRAYARAEALAQLPAERAYFGTRRDRLDSSPEDSG